MRLATSAAVLTLLGIQSGSGAIAAAEAALDATFPRVEALLESVLTAQSRVDSFDLGTYDTEGPTLRLHTGFVSSDTPVVVTVYGVEVSAADFRVDYDLGTVELYLSYAAGRRAVTVAYDHGFAADGDDATLFSGLPEALIQGSVITAAAFMMLNPLNIAKEKARFMAGVTVAGLELQARQALARYFRPRGTVVWSTHSEVV